MTPPTATTSGVGLFDLAERKLAWIGARESVLAQNVANADTPGFKARDVKPFAEVLKAGMGSDAGLPLRTNPLHLGGTASGSGAGQILRGEQAPDGNSVSLDEQMVKIAQTDNDHELVSAVYRKYLGMFRMALGR
jgi:flagellar basal-body rod protein FlgB